MKLKEDQLTVKWIGKIFNVFPDSIVLIRDDKGEVETPDFAGRFHTLEYHLEYRITADPLSTCTVTSSSTSPSLISNSSIPYQKPSIPSKGLSKKIKFGNPHRPPGVANQGEDWTKNIEIHRYYPQQAEFRKVINFPVLMSAETSSISEVASVISREAFEGKPIILLDNDYLVIPDTAASRGMNITCIIIANSRQTPIRFNVSPVDS